MPNSTPALRSDPMFWSRRLLKFEPPGTGALNSRSVVSLL
jgi:hypothetical protein